MNEKITIEDLNDLKLRIQVIHSRNFISAFEYRLLTALIDAAIARNELLQNPQQVQRAIDIIQSNWPPENYTMLREALTLSIAALESVQTQCGTKPETVPGCEGGEAQDAGI